MQFLEAILNVSPRTVHLLVDPLRILLQVGDEFECRQWASNPSQLRGLAD